MNILLVEDDPVLARGVQVSLEAAGYKIFRASNLREAFDINEKQKLALVVLDLGLSDGSGLDFLKKIRASKSRLPIIILSAQSDEDTVVEGLRLGANDYIKKPFGHKEFLARIKTALKESSTAEDKVRYGDFLILLEQRLVKYKDQTIELNRREFDILLLLVQRAETIVTRESLIQSLDKEGEIFDRTIDSHISHLRSRFRTYGITAVKISSIYGVGYRLEKI